VLDPVEEWPIYDVGPAKHLHALGVVSQNFSFYEWALVILFERFLQKDFANFIFHQMNNEERAGTVRHLFGLYEKDPAVIEHVEHLLRHFSACASNRNSLIHSKRHFAVSLTDMLSVEKVPRNNFQKINVFHLSLGQLRDIADHMMRGITFLLDLWRYLRDRDDPPSGAHSRTLPEKPQIPDNLRPHRPPVNRRASRRRR
jgi:hypothetical protein